MKLVISDTGESAMKKDSASSDWWNNGKTQLSEQLELDCNYKYGKCWMNMNDGRYNTVTRASRDA